MQPQRQILDRMMEAAIDGGSWPGALTALAQACRADVGSMILVDRGSGAGTGFCLGVDERWAAPFVARQARHVAIGAHAVAPGAVFTDRTAVDRRLFERSQFYEDWAAPSGQTEFAGVAVVNEPERFAFVGLARGRRGAFREDELAALGRLAPHVRRAAKIWVALGAAEETRASLEAAFDGLAHGIFLTDAAGRLAFANRAGTELLAGDDGLILAEGALGARGPGACERLRSAISLAARRDEARAPGARLRIDRVGGAGPLTLLVAPLATASPRPARAEVMVIALGAGAASEAERRLRLDFGLTAAEAAVAGRLAGGGGLKAAARALEIAPTTARTHLKRVFAKTGARNQVELAGLIAAGLIIKD